MTFPNSSKSACTEDRSPSGSEAVPPIQHQTNRYETPDVIRLGEIAHISHNQGPARESVASYWQRG